MAALVVAPLAVIAFVAAWSRVDPFGSTPPGTAFRGGTNMGSTRPAAIGVPYSVDIAYDLPPVVLRSATPVLRPGAAPTAISVTWCRPRLDPPASSDGSLAAMCSAVEPITDLDLARAGGGRRPGDRLVLTIVPLAPGAIHVRAVDLTYEQDGHQRHQRLDTTIDLPGS